MTPETRRAWLRFTGYVLRLVATAIVVADVAYLRYLGVGFGPWFKAGRLRPELMILALTVTVLLWWLAEHFGIPGKRWCRTAAATVAVLWLLFESGELYPICVMVLQRFPISD